VADRLVVDLNPDGTASVSAWPEGEELPGPGPSFELAWPLNGDALEDLRWYLEDYLILPSGVYGDRGQEIQRRLAEWGTGMFRAVFGSGPARDAYVRLRSRAAGTKLVFRSSSPRLLALPWELLRDPALPAPLALDLAGVSRALPDGQGTETVPVPGGRLRVLMVIARPYGGTDIGYQMIARPLLQRLDAVRGEVDLVVLRPPTLDALAAALSQASAEGAPFHVVHFDGHGQQNEQWFPSRGPGDELRGELGEGMLVFESPRGLPVPAPASRIARVLSAAKVPVVVLNACQSGAIGKTMEAAIATRLMQEGIASVVAMAYSVYAVAAAEFMVAFYERLFAGDPVSAAVTAGRRQMAVRNERPSRKGGMPLEDWLVPVHYLRRDVRFPQSAARRAGPLSLDEELDRVPGAGSVGAGDLDPAGVFIGRDWLTCQLETAARQHRVVVLHGPGGTGKTELAKAFGRWWRDTGGVEDSRYVFFYSFEPGMATSGLDGVVNEIGRELFGTDFDRREPAERRAAVEKALTERRMLLIWDSFEIVRSMPDPNHLSRPLDEDGRRDLRDFLGRLAAHGKSAVLITSRAPEPWLGDVRRIPVGGLTPPEADQYATSLLKPYPAAQERQRKPVFGDLMDWLDGHPLSMRLILLHLDRAEPAALLDALRGTVPLPGAADADRMTSLPASITYSYAHLSGHTRRLLPALCLLQRTATVPVLEKLSRDPGVPERFRGAAPEDWRNALDEAAGVGLLTRLGASTYQMHPALPAYLAARWRQDEPAGHDGARDAASRAMARVYAGLGQLTLQQVAEDGDAALVFAAIDIEYRNLASMLGYVLAFGLWPEAGEIFWALLEYWHCRGLFEEARAWADRVRLAAQAAAAEAAADGSVDNPAIRLWLDASCTQVHFDIERSRLDHARRSARQIRAWLEAQPPSAQQREYLAMVDKQFDRLGEPAWAGHDSENLASGRPGDTEKLPGDNRRSGEMPDGQFTAAATLLDHGNAAWQRGELAEAQDRYRRSLALYKKIGQKSGIAHAYRGLGEVAVDRGQFAYAEDLLREALVRYEELGNSEGIALTYILFGELAGLCGRHGEAGDWLSKAVAIVEEDGKPLTEHPVLLKLSMRAVRQGRQVLERAIRRLALFEEFSHPEAEEAARELAELTRTPAMRVLTLGERTLDDAWRTVTGNPLPQAVLDYMESGEADG
jgi:tetratricopeptide (TPR) repeat protein